MLNATVIRRGGGVQACAAFVRQLLGSDQAQYWYFALSDTLAAQLAGLGVTLPVARTEVFPASPARSWAARQRLLGLERSLGPGLVFTYFGPAYVRFRGYHLCGVADGWVTHADAWAYSSLGAWPARLHMRLLCAYKAHWFKAADAWLVEAPVARAGLAQRLEVASERIEVVPNSCAPHYLGADSGPVLIPPDGRVRILCFSADYPHKNLSLIPEVARRLDGRLGGRQPEFMLTLPQGEAGERRIRHAARALGVGHAVRNLGPVSLEAGPSLYRSCDLLFHPSLLETFPATYPESMAMGVPIVTSDLPFARSICGDAARYFSPGDAQAAAEAIGAVATDEELRLRLIGAGRRRLEAISLPQHKHARLLALLDAHLGRGVMH